ncbi:MULTISPECIES: MarR family transcriptional regulator [Kitasatospora]|uniref:Putative acetamidase regulator n=1 Tax=Kitasatospora setae (strain ATCC 33774 / DSM 43861 / JCM 3304 / KCC A-0304 / NBRC 14216 / KM-6054) TaxID=452652 RepID=E4N5G9_KITSK|nr:MULTISPECIES: MarR family transcriptional regulator [Kitasatospora]BAJ26450.1 putative acetamidase regulator [Kitasatospora setae KM-6054]
MSADATTRGAAAREAATPGAAAREAATPGAAPAPLLVELVALAHRRLTGGLAAALAEEDCTVDQWRVLRALADEQGHAMGELAQSLLIPQASLSRLVDALADAGLVYRRQGDQDRRRITAHLSRRGRTRLTRLDALAAAHDAAVRAACALAAAEDGALARLAAL